MGTNVNITITATGQGAQAVIQNLQRALGNLRAQAQSATPHANRFAESLRSIRNQAIAVGIAFKGALAFGRFIQEGLKFNEVVESATIGIASLIAAESELVTSQGEVLRGADAMAGAMIHARDQINQLRVAGLRTAATTEQLTDAFQQSVGAGLAAGLQLDEIRKLTIQIVQAAGALGVPLNQLNQEVRSILDATIDRNSRVARVLGITNAEVRANRELGTLYKFLNKELESFTIASEEAANTWRVVKSNVLEAFQVFAGDATKPFFDQIKVAFKGALNSLFDFDQARISRAFAGLLEGSQEAFSNLGRLVSIAIAKGVSGAEALSQWLQANTVAVTEFLDALSEVAIELGGLIKDAIKLVGAVVDWGIKSGAFVGALNTIKDLLSIIRDFLPVIAVAIGVKIVAAMTTWASTTKAVQLGFLGITGALEAFNIAFASNPVGLALIGIALAGGAAVLAINQVIAAEEQREALEDRIRGILVRQTSESIKLSTEVVKLAQAFRESNEEGRGLADQMDALAKAADELIAKDERYRAALFDQTEALKKAAESIRQNALQRANLARAERQAQGVLESSTATDKEKADARLRIRDAVRQGVVLEKEYLKLVKDQKGAIDDEVEAIQKKAHALVGEAAAREERGKMTVADLERQIAVERERLAGLQGPAGAGGATIIDPRELTHLNELNATLTTAKARLQDFSGELGTARNAARLLDDAIADTAPTVKPIRGTDSQSAAKASKLQNDLKQQAEADIRAIKAILSEVESQLDVSLKTQKLSLTNYVQALETAQLAAVEKEIAIRERLRTRLTDPGERDQQEGLIRELQAKRVEIIGDAQIKVFEGEKELSDKVADIRRKVMENEGLDFESRADSIKASFRDLLKELELEGRDADIQIVLKFIAQENMKVEIDRFKDETDDLQTELQTRLQNIEARKVAGVLGTDQAKAQVIFTYEQIITKIKEARDAYQILSDLTGDPKMADALAKVDEKLAELSLDLINAKNTASEFAKDLVAAFQGGLVEFLTADLSALDKFDNAFRAMAESIIRSIQRMVAEMIAFQILKGIFSLAGFTLGGTSGSVTVGKKARGGAITEADRPKILRRARGGPVIYQKGNEEAKFWSTVRRRANGGPVIDDEEEEQLRRTVRRRADGGAVIDDEEETEVRRVIRRRAEGGAVADKNEEEEIRRIVRRRAEGGAVIDKDEDEEIRKIVRRRAEGGPVVDDEEEEVVRRIVRRRAQGGAVVDEEEEEEIRRTVRRRARGGSVIDEEEDFPKLALRKLRGGGIYGPGGEKEDRVPIWASPGEYILSAPAVRRLGGVKEVDKINFGASTARPRSMATITRHFKDGGAVQGQNVSSVNGGFDATVGLEDGLVLKQVTSRQGTNVLLKHISKNPDQFRAALGL